MRIGYQRGLMRRNVSTTLFRCHLPAELSACPPDAASAVLHCRKCNSNCVTGTHHIMCWSMQTTRTCSRALMFSAGCTCWRTMP